MGYRYRGLQKLRVLTTRSNIDDIHPDSLPSADELKSMQAAVRRRFVDTLLAEVESLNKLSDEFRALAEAQENASEADRERVAKAQEHVFARSMEGWNSFAKECIADYDSLFSDLQSTREHQFRTIDDLEGLTRDYEEESGEWRAKIETITTMAKELEQETHLAHETNSKALMEAGKLMRDTAEITGRLLYQGPLLSVAMEEFLKAKRTQLPSNSRGPVYFEQRINAFLEIIGDKCIADYSEGDLTNFAGKLQFLPERHTVDPEWWGKSLVAAIEENRNRPFTARASCLSYTTIKIGYVGKIKTCIRWLCANHHVRYPFEYGYTLIPKDARSPLVRFSLDANRLNVLFAECVKDADEKRPEDVWLPLLAYLTGARLGELVGLQPHNVTQLDNVDIIDLTTQISDVNGTRNRSIKSRESQRIFVLHRCLRNFGFIDWVDAQRELGHDYLFPDLHTAKRPTHAASKRFQRLFARIGMGGSLVFHSLRHSFKDWARSQCVPERTITLQTGHSLDGIALKYGSKLLRSDEVQLIDSLKLREGVNFEVFKGVRPKSTVPPPADGPSRRQRSVPTPPTDRRARKSPTNRAAILSSRKKAPAQEIDVRDLRSKLKLSQREFCSAFEISIGALRDWEQGRSKPGRAARALLSSISLGQNRVQAAGSTEALGRVAEPTSE